MTLSRLVIANVRCIEAAALHFGPGRNFLIGANGAGKTSVLEAVHLLGRGRSFRTRQTRGLVRLGGGALSVFGELSDGTVGAAAQCRIGVGLGEEGLVGRIDGAPAEGLVDLARRFAVHVVDPKLHSLIEAGPSERRRFVDAGVFHVEPSYLGHWRDFRRILSQRNAVLKSGRLGQLSVWDDPLIRAAEAVDRLRTDYVAGLAEIFTAIGERLLGLDVSLTYQSGWRQGIGFAEALAGSLARDRLTGTTQAGPHRADISIRFVGGAVRELASRGQQKLVAAALVLSQVAEFERRTSRRGTLLVDDPAAELDDAALERLLGEVDRLQAQVLVTGLRLASLDARAGEPVFHVERGSVKPMVY